MECALGIAVLSLFSLLGARGKFGTKRPPGCSGYATQIMTSAPVNCSGSSSRSKEYRRRSRFVSGEQSDYKIHLTRGDYVHINRGMDKGIRGWRPRSGCAAGPGPI